MLWGGDRNIMEEDMRAGLKTECEGEESTLCHIHLHSASLAPALDVGKMVLEGLGSGVKVRVTIKDTAVYNVYKTGPRTLPWGTKALTVKQAECSAP